MIASERRKIIIAVVLALVIVLPVASFLAYYYQPIRGSLSPSSTTIVKGQSVQFDFIPSHGVGPYRYSWSFGDGGNSTEKDPIHAYSIVGTYTVTVTVTDKAGVEGSWITTITVRLPLVFIDKVSYPSWVAFYLGDTYCKLFVDGHQVIFQTASLQPGTTHGVELQIIGVANFNAWGGPTYETTLLDEKGTVTAPTTQTDLHCVLNYNPVVSFGDPKFTLSAV